MEQDVFNVDLREADVVVMYLLPWMVNRLVPQFEVMQPGIRIVAHDFGMEEIEPEKMKSSSHYLTPTKSERYCSTSHL